MPPKAKVAIGDICSQANSPARGNLLIGTERTRIEEHFARRRQNDPWNNFRSFSLSQL